MEPGAHSPERWAISGGFWGPRHGSQGLGRLHSSFTGRAPQAWEALGALGVKGLGWVNSECVKAREIRLQR